MRYLIFIIIGLLIGIGQLKAAPRTIHVMVALCDNANQGIVPVPKSIGNGQDPRNNLYWGAQFGIKSHLKKSPYWTLLNTEKNIGDLPDNVLERIIFKHKEEDVYLVADAYDGAFIKETTLNFIFASGGYEQDTVTYQGVDLPIGGASNMITYIGHNGLMDFDYEFGCILPANCEPRDIIMLGCITKRYFSDIITCMDANPILWTTGLMAPEAYTLEAALQGWIYKESTASIQHRAAAAYHQYQKCGIRGARNLLVPGF